MSGGGLFTRQNDNGEDEWLVKFDEFTIFLPFDTRWCAIWSESCAYLYVCRYVYHITLYMCICTA